MSMVILSHELLNCTHCGEFITSSDTLPTHYTSLYIHSFTNAILYSKSSGWNIYVLWTYFYTTGQNSMQVEITCFVIVQGGGLFVCPVRDMLVPDLLNVLTAHIFWFNNIFIRVVFDKFSSSSSWGLPHLFVFIVITMIH